MLKRFDMQTNYYYYRKCVIIDVGEQTMKTYTITPKGQVTVPVEVRERLKLKPGDRIVYEDTNRGVVLKPAQRDMLADFGFLKTKQKTIQNIEVVRKAVRKKMAARHHPK